MPRLSTAAREIATVIRRHRLTYPSFHKAVRAARIASGLTPPSTGRRLPKILTDDALKAYFDAVASGGNLQHELMLKLLLYTGGRVSELCSIRMSDVDLRAKTIFIEKGKGDKDRKVLFKDEFRLALESYIRAHPDNVYLFESAQRRPYSTRRIEQIVAEYGAMAQLTQRVHPHMFRHQLLTWLKRNKLEDAQIQLVSGHATRDSLEVYTHLALSDVSGDYQDAMRKLPV
jgi:integrase